MQMQQAPLKIEGVLPKKRKQSGDDLQPPAPGPSHDDQSHQHRPSGHEDAPVAASRPSADQASVQKGGAACAVGGVVVKQEPGVGGSPAASTADDHKGKMVAACKTPPRTPGQEITATDAELARFGVVESEGFLPNELVVVPRSGNRLCYARFIDADKDLGMVKVYLCPPNDGAQQQKELPGVLVGKLPPLRQCKGESVHTKADRARDTISSLHSFLKQHLPSPEVMTAAAKAIGKQTSTTNKEGAAPALSSSVLEHSLSLLVHQASLLHSYASAASSATMPAELPPPPTGDIKAEAATATGTSQDEDVAALRKALRDERAAHVKELQLLREGINLQIDQAIRWHSLSPRSERPS
ncbi:unnamed protein product [Vitrella brassicaformis CCMP3155]|uniref:Uncharacterized protein n=1 Tax=Vitrella brassicaformis (strain CCMP3155) TaxID=1169540 RepID=A0A0G4ES36_VITBC|nr:unnamed protein product [Vitrella brassicaformis CCMP3155]|eukprot:CEM01115.1 unnamed protein product [Vitrella brassicaformis CCMP3155]